MNLISLADNLWVAEQPQKFFGLEVGTRMVVVRLSHGDLVLISPIQLDQSDRPILNELGTVHHLIAPNRFHHLYLGQAQALFPDAIAWGVEGLKQKRPDLKLDKIFEQSGSFDDELDYLPFQGFGTILPSGIELANETVFFHRASRTLILTDTAFNFDENSSDVLQMAARLFKSYQVLKPSILEKWGSREKEKVEASVRQVLDWDFDRVVLAHGGIVHTGGKEKFKSAYEWFLGHAL